MACCKWIILLTIYDLRSRAVLNVFHNCSPHKTISKKVFPEYTSLVGAYVFHESRRARCMSSSGGGGGGVRRRDDRTCRPSRTPLRIIGRNNVNLIRTAAVFITVRSGDAVIIIFIILYAVWSTEYLVYTSIIRTIRGWYYIYNKPFQLSSVLELRATQERVPLLFLKKIFHCTLSNIVWYQLYI